MNKLCDPRTVATSTFPSVANEVTELVVIAVGVSTGTRQPFNTFPDPVSTLNDSM